MTLSCLIFDVDGTLSETEEAHRHAFNDMFTEYGLPWHWDSDLYRILLRTTGGKERMRAYVEDHLNQTADLDQIAKMHIRKTERYGELLDSGAVRLRPGIRELITDAKVLGCRLAVATTTNRPNVERLTQACFGVPAEEIFEVIAAGDEVEAKKPAPDVYNLALSQLSLPPESCVALEDSRNGLRSALGARLRCIVSPSRYTNTDDFTEATATIDSFEQIASFAQVDLLLKRQARQTEAA